MHQNSWFLYWTAQLAGSGKLYKDIAEGRVWVGQDSVETDEASRVCNPPTVICQAQSDTDFVQEVSDMTFKY